MTRGAAALLVLLVALSASGLPRAEAQGRGTAPPVQPAKVQPGPSQPGSSQPGATNVLGLAGDDNNNKPLDIEADNGIEWQQSNRVYIARGHAKATRGDDTVTADTLYAYYRPVQQNPGQQNAGQQNAGQQNVAQQNAPAQNGLTPTKAAMPVTPSAPGAQDKDAGSPGQSPFENGSTQIYRIEADGNVVFTTPTQTAYGDHAIYDVDQALLVVTGKHLKIVTPQDVVTARDSLEWYDQKQIGVARGDAVAVRQGPDQKSIRGDILVADVTHPANQPAKISKVDAQGHVVLVSQDEIAKGDAGVYNLDTGIATLSGHVTVTRGDNVLRGQYAVVDTNKNVARLLSAPPSAKLTGPPPRVEGLLIPRKQDEQSLHPTAAPASGAKH